MIVHLNKAATDGITEDWELRDLITSTYQQLVKEEEEKKKEAGIAEEQKRIQQEEVRERRERKTGLDKFFTLRRGEKYSMNDLQFIRTDIHESPSTKGLIFFPELQGKLHLLLSSSSSKKEMNENILFLEELDQSKMTEEERKEYNRKNVIKEIIITEADYVKDLEVIINVGPLFHPIHLFIQYQLVLFETFKFIG